MMLIGSTSVVKAEGETAEPKLTIDPVEIAVGEEAEISVKYESEIDYSGYQFRVSLPEGLSFVSMEVEDEDGEMTTAYGTLGDACLASHASDISIIKKEGSYMDGTLFFIVYHLKNKMLKSGKTLCKFKVKADEKLPETTQIKWLDTQFTAIDVEAQKVYSTGFMSGTIDVKKSTVPTGINGVEAEAQTTDAVYSIGGVRLNKAAKGVNVVIRNGKAIKVVK